MTFLGSHTEEDTSHLECPIIEAYGLQTCLCLYQQ